MLLERTVLAELFTLLISPQLALMQSLVTITKLVCWVVTVLLDFQGLLAEYYA